MAESALTLSVDSFWISPYAFSCYVALKEKVLPFEVRAVSLPDKEHHPPEYQQQSMTVRVTTPLSPAPQEAARRLMAFAQAAVPEGRSSLFGVPWTAADTDLAFMLQRLNLNGFELPPAVRRFVEAQWQRPSVQEWVNHKRLP